MALRRVHLSTDVYFVCLNHAMCTEGEEIVGLLVGEVDEERIAHVVAVLILRRSDKRKDRVEISPEQLSNASTEAEKLACILKRPVRVVGWYHSHPKLTVYPSLVDVCTQESYQLMDEGFIGMIFSVFNTDPNKFGGRIQMICYQSQTVIIDCNVEKSHVEIPIRLVPSRNISDVCMNSVVQLPRFLCQEEQLAYQMANQVPLDYLTRLHNSSVYLRKMGQIAEVICGPLLKMLEERILNNEMKRKRLQERKKALTVMVDKAHSEKVKKEKERSKKERERVLKESEIRGALRKARELQALQLEKQASLRKSQSLASKEREVVLLEEHTVSKKTQLVKDKATTDPVSVRKVQETRTAGQKSEMSLRDQEVPHLKELRHEQTIPAKAGDNSVPKRQEKIQKQDPVQQKVGSLKQTIEEEVKAITKSPSFSSNSSKTPQDGSSLKTSPSIMKSPETSITVEARSKPNGSDEVVNQCNTFESSKNNLSDTRSGLGKCQPSGSGNVSAQNNLTIEEQTSTSSNSSEGKSVSKKSPTHQSNV